MEALDLASPRPLPDDRSGYSGCFDGLVLEDEIFWVQLGWLHLAPGMQKAPGGVAAGRLQDVCGGEIVGDVADRESFGRQLRWIRDDLDLVRVAGEHFDVANASHARQRRAHHEETVIVEVGRRQAAGKIETEEGKR